MFFNIINALASLHISSLAAYCPSTFTAFCPLNWLAIASLVVLVVIVIAAVVYILGSLLASNAAKLWAKIQIYQALISIVLLIIFSMFAFLFFLNPQNAFQALCLVPADKSMLSLQCQPKVLSLPTLGAPTTFGCTTATSIYSLAACDLDVFDSAAFQLANYTYLISYVGGITPGATILITPIPSQPGISFQFGLPGILPTSDEAILGIIYSAFVTLIMINQVQLIVIGASSLFLFIFVTLGIVMRTVGLSRRFGGALIALGLGLGLIYPLVVSFMYGFIDTYGNLACLSNLPCSLGYFTLILNIMFSFVLSSVTQSPLAVSTGTPLLLAQFGYLIAGFTFIPFLTFAIVNAFVLDFSSAIGERLDFASLLINVI